MTNNIGGKIKTFAQVYLIVGIAATVIACIVIPCVIGFNDSSFVIDVITVVGSLIVFPLVYFLLYGFGQLVSDTDASKEYLRILAAGAAKEAHPADSTANEKKAQALAPVAAKPAAAAPSGKKCPKCGCHNPTFAFSCKDCGASF